jgi:regulator of sigma E protease
MILTALTFFLVLSILVFIHELGHFALAKWIGVAVEEFGFGLPPRIFGKKIGKTIYSLNWLPIGGFVKLSGEDEDPKRLNLAKQGSTLKKFFWFRSKKERAAILIAGVVMNFLLAVGITAYLLTDGVMEPSGRVHVEKVQPGTPAEIAGLVPNDIIKPFHTAKDLIETTKTHAGTPVVLTVLRDGKEMTLSLTPRKDPPPGEGAMGVVVSDLEKKTYSLGEAPFKAVEINLSRASQMLVSLGGTVWRLVTLQPLRADVAGPIGIAQVTGEVVKYGFRAVLELMSILSLNLAVLNILPFPALDGGRLAFVFLEKIFGRRIKPAFERSTHQIGMLILFILILLVSFNDILRLARGG